MDRMPKSHSQGTADCLRQQLYWQVLRLAKLLGGMIQHCPTVLDECVQDFALIFIFPGRLGVREFNSCWLLDFFFLKLLSFRRM